MKKCMFSVIVLVVPVLAIDATSCGGKDGGPGDGAGDAADIHDESDSVTETPADTPAQDGPDAWECASDLDCDDSNPCTVDTCDTDFDTCEHDGVDADGDGYAAESVGGVSCGGSDCDDADHAVNPGAGHACDGWDHDCDDFVLFLGRGHTRGDIVVFLPRERVLCTGDLFNGYIGYMGDAYVDEWADSLDRLARLDFETVIPGHGAPFVGKSRIAPVRACLRDLWRQAQDLERAGMPADEAASRIDLRAHATEFPSLAGPGFNPTAIRRIYEVLAERRR